MIARGVRVCSIIALFFSKCRVKDTVKVTSFLANSTNARERSASVSTSRPREDGNPNVIDYLDIDLNRLRRLPVTQGTVKSRDHVCFVFAKI